MLSPSQLFSASTSTASAGTIQIADRGGPRRYVSRERGAATQIDPITGV
jgi:hypothetical protein